MQCVSAAGRLRVHEFVCHLANDAHTSCSGVYCCKGIRISFDSSTLVHYAVLHTVRSASRREVSKLLIPVPVLDRAPRKFKDKSQLSLKRNEELRLFTGCSSGVESAVVEKLDPELDVEWKKWTRVRANVTTVLIQFLRMKGLDSARAEQAVQESSTFIAHLLTLLTSCFPARHLTGEDVTESEIRSVLLPYLENLIDTHGEQLDILVDFTSIPGELLPSFLDLSSFVPQPRNTKEILSGYPLLLEHLVDDKLPSSLSYFLSIGLKPAQIDHIVRKFPPIVGYSFEGKIQKVVDFLLSLGVPSSHIPKILLKRPHLFGYSIEENLKPTAIFLESLGVERKRWPRILVSFPHMLTYSQSKTALIFNFLLQVGFTEAGIGRVFNRFPHIVGYSVEGKLRPLAEYFHSIGIEDFSHIVMRSPQTLGLSLECNIKPTVEFFLSLGFKMEELVFVLVRFPQILGLNVEHNLQPKWDFFLRMNRSRSELVDFPQYFGYSLENRIEPRYKVVVEKGLAWTLNRMLSSPEKVFQKLHQGKNESMS
ncbi:hypothetical protein R1flu_007847 [Riccia fluitans]|uniref:Uncharacterized protein n=1 Tax=Riccia fluitans TaxID=41844 RepID=A0ABD1Z0V2_9MARC